MSRLLRVLVVVLASALVVSGAACADADEPAAPSRGPTGALTVLAAASLTEAFGALGEAFEARHPGTAVTTSFAASSELVAQVNEGVPADVVATADEATMVRLTDGIGTIGEPAVFATNELAIIVEPGNPLGITDLADLADPDVVVVTAAPEVPIGRYSQQVLSDAGVEVTPRSLEQSVRGVVSKVVLGEADAGIVYATDARAAGDRADGVALPAELGVRARYPIAVPAGVSNPITAEAFVGFVRSPAGQTILESFGFGPP
jgi:molybdate transport system substrate-binding protein